MQEHAHWPTKALLPLRLLKDVRHLHTRRWPLRILHDALEVIEVAPGMLALALALLVLLAADGWLAATGCCCLLLVVLSLLLAGCWRYCRRGNGRVLLRLMVRRLAVKDAGCLLLATD